MNAVPLVGRFRSMSTIGDRVRAEPFARYLSDEGLDKIRCGDENKTAAVSFRI